MNGMWMTLLSIALGGLGVLVELNLLRIFIRDWREGVREDRARSFPAAPAQTIPVQPRHSKWPRIHPRAAACIAIPALISPIAHAVATSCNHSCFV
jgi:hypothetical protein